MDPLIIDSSPYSPIKPQGYRQLVSAGLPWSGVILKASEGVGGGVAKWQRRLDEWFPVHWQAVRDAGLERYGDTWFRGAYHFLICNDQGAAQAEHFLRTIDRAGGWDRGDIFPIVDVEEGSGNRSMAGIHGNQIVIETCMEFVEKVKQETGRQVILYAGHWLHEMRIKTRMGCDWLWYARYTAKLPASVYTSIGWNLERLMMWQYDGSGDNNGHLQDYPVVASMNDGESVDISALTMAGGVERLRQILFAERP